MVYEVVASLDGADVLRRAKEFFAERVPMTAAFPEKEGPTYLTLRGQGGEEVAIAVFAAPNGTRVRASTLLFDQPLDRFLSTLPLHRRQPREWPLPLRVMVQDAWDEIPLDLPASTSLADVKRRALKAAQVYRDPNEYVLKFRGAELRDESQSLAEAGLVANGALIVLPRRRRPVR